MASSKAQAPPRPSAPAYNALPTHASPARRAPLTRTLATALRTLMLAAGFSALLALAAYSRATPAPALDLSARVLTLGLPELGLPAAVYENLAMYAPYFPAGAYLPPPLGCEITQVNILQRHGARYPTTSAAGGIKSAVAKLQNASAYTDPAFDFIKSYRYNLSTDSLVPFGAAQSFEAGEQAFLRYGWLASAKNLPFVRASSSQRVVDSATNWTAGFAAASLGRYHPTLSVVLNEAANDTLDDNMCPAAGSSSAQTNTWLAASSPPTAARIAEAAPGVNLTNADVNALESLCAFDSVVAGRASKWCGIFKTGDFEAFEYYGDLNKYYGTGPGQALGRVQGVGYVNELLARLTGTPVNDTTQTNRTLDSSPTTFPLHRALYADFSHDNQIVAILAALGLFAPSSPLDPARPDPARRYVASRLVPFSARVVTERLACGGGAQHVRVFVNDALQSLPFCGGALGVCELGAFVRSQAYARAQGEGDWEKCFA